MKIIIPSLLILLSLCLLGCSRETTVSGEVFVVTQGAGSYKLGLVEVQAIPESAVLEMLKSQTNQEEITAARAKYEEAQAEATRAEEASKQARERYERDRDELGSTLDWSKPGALAEAERRQSDLSSRSDDYKAAERLASAARQRAASALDAVDEALSPWRHLLSLPTPIATATTNADGKFEIRLPKTGRYALAARASRRVVDKDETYYWLVWVQADGSPKTLLLSNNNLVGSGSPDSVLDTGAGASQRY